MLLGSVIMNGLGLQKIYTSMLDQRSLIIKRFYTAYFIRGLQRSGVEKGGSVLKLDFKNARPKQQFQNFFPSRFSY